MKTSLLTIISLLAYTLSFGQLKQLEEVQKFRLRARAYKQAKNWDSACISYSRFASNLKYSNSYDHLDYSYCSMKRGDTALFASFLGASIAEGMDTTTIYRWYPARTPAEQAMLDGYINAHYPGLHKTFVLTHDTALISEMEGIREMDQLVRTPLQKRVGKDRNAWTTDSNVVYLTALGKFADSLNYSRIVRLFKNNEFPGYHNCGPVATGDLWTALLHLDYAFEDWDFIFSTLKKAVLNGDIDPDQVVSIADRHYLGMKNPSYYYGHLKWGDKIAFYDCKNVDKARAEIGYETLQSEYERTGRTLPECYTRN